MRCQSEEEAIANMCGIAGIICLSRETATVNSEQLEIMKAGIKHRGPDAEGHSILRDGSGFVHTRLAIIDLEDRSKQPFFSPDENYSVTFNGEIFNYLELRDELESLGHSFRTQSDTEVLLHAYIHWGQECVQKFNGMWAFAIFDSTKNLFFCSRDRFGIKPFVYGVAQERLYFASEAKAILKVAPTFKRPNYNSLSLLLRGSISGLNPETCFEGLHRLPPAHNLVIQNGNYRVERYWDYPNEKQNISFKDASEELHSLLSESIRLRLRSDVPIGISLSGGLDSSLIACLSHQNGGTAIKTYTASYDNYPQWDETPKATRLADSLGYSSRKIKLEKDDVLENMRQAIYHLETPHHSPAILAYWNIIRQASKEVKVLLEGQGADELLGGYVNVTSLAAIQDDITSFRMMEIIRRLKHGLSGELGFTGKRFAMELCRGVMPGLHDLYRRYRGDEQVYQLKLSGGPARLRQRNHKNHADSVTRSLIRQHEGGLQNLLLYGDAISMAHGLEARVPFMDFRLVEFAFQSPSEFHLRGGVGKALLRESSKKVLPPYILNEKRKLGFVTPISEWLRDDPNIAYDILLSNECRSRGLFDVPRMERLIQRHVSGKINIFSQIYRWLITEIWFQEFID
ncbi:asparagine synthase (glutamine-hydrolyzing) [Mariniblastus sp.]|nr:asparagine synthase (glutamine-hydrolyzing) [Mariniblastus sp.]